MHDSCNVCGLLLSLTWMVVGVTVMSGAGVVEGVVGSSSGDAATVELVAMTAVFDAGDAESVGGASPEWGVCSVESPDGGSVTIGAVTRSDETSATVVAGAKVVSGVVAGGWVESGWTGSGCDAVVAVVAVVIAVVAVLIVDVGEASRRITIGAPVVGGTVFAAVVAEGASCLESANGLMAAGAAPAVTAAVPTTTTPASRPCPTLTIVRTGPMDVARVCFLDLVSLRNISFSWLIAHHVVDAARGVTECSGDDVTVRGDFSPRGERSLLAGHERGVARGRRRIAAARRQGQSRQEQLDQRTDSEQEDHRADAGSDPEQDAADADKQLDRGTGRAQARAAPADAQHQAVARPGAEPAPM